MAFVVVVVVVVNFLGVKLLISGRKGIRLRHCLCFIATLFQTSTVPVLGPVTKETLISSEYEYEIEYDFKISDRTGHDVLRDDLEYMCARSNTATSNIRYFSGKQ